VDLVAVATITEAMETMVTIMVMEIILLKMVMLRITAM
jgi:hypothetical protein